MSALRNVIHLVSAKPLPVDPDQAADAVIALVEQSDITLDDSHDDAVIECNGRCFLVVWGAGRDLVEVSSFAGEPVENPLLDAFLDQRLRYNEQALEWPIDADQRLRADGSIDDVLALQFFAQAERMRQAPVMTVRPGISRGLQIVLITIGVAFLITVVGALANDDSMERCQLTSSFDTCFTALNR